MVSSIQRLGLTPNATIEQRKLAVDLAEVCAWIGWALVFCLNPFSLSLPPSLSLSLSLSPPPSLSLSLSLFLPPSLPLSQVIIKWEFQRVRELQDSDSESMEHEPVHKEPLTTLAMKRSASDGTAESKRQRTQTQVADPNWALEKQHTDAVLNFLIRLACQVNDAQSSTGTPPGVPGSPGEALSKRCISLVKTALKPDIWPSE